ncbi:MAG: hypothetical protein K0S32_700, partial [Bacteroidetes bacterium]|nr:hypothetical protein [Bacteroidota bacterium]
MAFRSAGYAAVLDAKLAGTSMSFVSGAITDGSFPLGDPGKVVYDGKAEFGTNFVGESGGPNQNPYTLKDPNGKILRPKDAIDASTQRHDYGYWKQGAGGLKDF